MLNKIEEETAPDSQPLTPTPEAPADPEVTAQAPVPESKLRLKAKELGYADDGDFEDFVLNHINGIEENDRKSQEVNGALYDALMADPTFMEVVKMVVIDHKPFRVAINSVFSPEELQGIEGDEDFTDIEAAKKNRQSKLEADKKSKADRDANVELSQQAIRDFATENNLTEDQSKEFLSKVDEALSDLYMGKITKNFLSSMFRALNYDKAVNDARQMGEIAGRNANIETNIVKSVGDGLPNLQTGGELKPKEERKKSRMEELRDEEKKRRMI